MQKSAQNLDGFKISPEELDSLLNESDVGDLRMELDEDEIVDEDLFEPVDMEPIEEETPNQIILIEPMQNNSVDFGKLDNIPGAEDQDEIEIPQEEVSEDPWHWTHENWLEWCQNRKENIPKHSGRDITGLERVISYLERWLSELSKIARTDHDGIVNVTELEKIRNELIEGIERCKDRLEKLISLKGKKGKKKKADEEYELVKEAGTPKIVITTDLLISSIVRICINSAVSAGHDLTQTLTKLAKEYDLNKREKLQTIQLLADMGWATYLDRGLIEKELDITSPNNFDWMANYPG